MFHFTHCAYAGGLVNRNVSFVGNTAGAYGGATYISTANYGGSITNSKYSQNVAKVDGGAIYFSTGNGNGLFSYGNDFQISDSRFFENSALRGGAIFGFSRNNVVIKQSVLSDNNVQGSGGAIYLEQLNVFDLDSVQLLKNFAVSSGGGIASISKNQLSCTSVCLSRNAAGQGGGLYINDGTQLDINNVNFTYNSAASGGAARRPVCKRSARRCWPM